MGCGLKSGLGGGGWERLRSALDKTAWHEKAIAGDLWNEHHKMSQNSEFKSSQKIKNLEDAFLVAYATRLPLTPSKSRGTFCS